jgi:hypothetical protein
MVAAGSTARRDHGRDNPLSNRQIGVSLKRRQRQDQQGGEMLFLQPMPMDDVAAANRPVAAEFSQAEARAKAAPAWNGMRLAQAPGTPGSPSPNPGAGSLLEAPGTPAADTPVPPPRPNNVNNNGRSPIDSSGSGAGMGSDPGSTTREPPTPDPARPDATTPGTTPTPTTTPPSPIDDTKAPEVPDQTPLPGTGGTSGPLTPPSQQTPAPSSADPGAATAPTPAPSTTTPPTSATTPPASSSSPTDMGASGTR